MFSTYPPDLTEAEKRLIYQLSGDFGESLAPYAEMASSLGWTEAAVLKTVNRFQSQGLIRRLGATLWHQKSGFVANAMIVWEVEADSLEKYGALLAAKSYVSHCYHRASAPGWPFNLYAMIHAQSRERLMEMADELKAMLQFRPWRILESLQELKKSSLRYFADGE